MEHSFTRNEKKNHYLRIFSITTSPVLHRLCFNIWLVRLNSLKRELFNASTCWEQQSIKHTLSCYTLLYFWKSFNFIRLKWSVVQNHYRLPVTAIVIRLRSCQCYLMLMLPNQRKRFNFDFTAVAVEIWRLNTLNRNWSLSFLNAGKKPL